MRPKHISIGAGLKKQVFARASVLFAVNILTAGMLSAQSVVPEAGNAGMKVGPVVGIQAYPFDLNEVRLLDGPFKEAMAADSRYLLRIEPDRLLSDFRVHAGLPAKDAKYGGWESSGLAGHTLGHYLSACSMAYAATDDKKYLDKVNYIVDELAACQSGPVKRAGYVGAIPGEDTLWMEVSAGKIRSRGFDLNGAWSPWYTVHKIMAGLLDAYLYCNNGKALQVEKRLADWTGSIVDHLNDSLLQKMLFCEYGGMNDVLVNTYAITGEKKYLDLSHKFHDKRILDSLALQKDILPGKHSNTQIPKVIGCGRRYELTGDHSDSIIAAFFWSTVVNDHSYATGGNSNYEYLGAARQLNDKLTDNTSETCNTYNMLKLTRHLFAWKPSATLMDYYEKALYNHILASQNHEDGMMCYFVPLRMGTRKEYSDPYNTFTCCVGSGMENHVKYGESIYYQGRDGSLYVNLFIPSRLNWKEKNLRVEMQTRLPDDDKVVLTIGAGSGAAGGKGSGDGGRVQNGAGSREAMRFPLRIRRPSWAVQGMQVKVNGQLVKDASLGADGYLVINRKWKDKDRIELYIPESMHTQALPDNPDRIALFYGPVMLAGILGNTEPDPLTGIPVLVSTSRDPGNWVRREGTEGLIFRTNAIGQPYKEKDVQLIPFNRTKNEYYSVYWDLFTPDSWAAQQQKYLEEKRRQQELETRTIDRLRVGEMQPERDHSFAGENLNTGEEHGQKLRTAEDGGYFSFTMRVDSAADNTLICSYWGSDHRGRIFDIQVDGQTIATQDLNGFKESKFYEISYPVPSSLTKGKQNVVVRFTAKTSKNSVGPVYGTIRMVRK